MVMAPDLVIGLAIGLLVGFAVGYGVRSFISYRRRQRARQRRMGRDARLRWRRSLRAGGGSDTMSRDEAIAECARTYWLTRLLNARTTAKACRNRLPSSPQTMRCCWGR